MGNELETTASNTIATVDSSATQTSNQEQTTAAETTEQKIDWSKIDPNIIPDEIVRKHKAAKELLDESVKRRKIISELKAQLEKAVEEKPADNKKKTESVVSDDAQVPAWATQIIEKMTAIETSAFKANRESLITKVIAKHGLPQEAIKFLAGDTEADLEASATELAKLTVPDKLKPGSGYGNAEDATARASRILAERIQTGTGGLPKEGKFFDPAVHRNK